MEHDTIALICKENKLVVETVVAGTTVTFLVDSGANVSVLPHHIARDAGLLGRLQPLNARLSNPVAQYSPIIHGVLREPLECSNGVQLRPMLVVMSPAIPILGLEALSSHRCILTCSRDRPSLRLRELRPAIPASFLTSATHVTCTIMGQQTSALLDTGSTCCFMSCRLAQELQLKVSKVNSVGASTITGTLPILGYTSEAQVTFLGLNVTTSFCVSDVEEKVVIGLNVLLDANIRLNFDVKTGHSGGQASR